MELAPPFEDTKEAYHEETRTEQAQENDHAEGNMDLDKVKQELQIDKELHPHVPRVLRSHFKISGAYSYTHIRTYYCEYQMT